MVGFGLLIRQTNKKKKKYENITMDILLLIIYLRNEDSLLCLQKSYIRTVIQLSQQVHHNFKGERTR